MMIFCNKMNLLAAGIVLGALSACTAGDAPGSVHLKGQVLGANARKEVMTYDGASSSLGNSKDIVLTLDAEGRFDTIIPLAKPAFYQIGRNTVYLTPGDELTMEIARDNEDSKFTGKGAEANEYMKSRLYPAAGSFLHGGVNLKSDFASTKQFIDSASVARRSQLKALQNVSDEFKRLEEARIDADVVNTYYYYPIYANMLAQVRKLPGLIVPRNQVDSFYLAQTTEMKPLVERLNEETLLDVAVVRSTLRSLMGGESRLQSWCEGISWNQALQEWADANKMAEKMLDNISQEVLDEVTGFAKGMKNKELAYELLQKVEESGKLVKGTPAIDFVLEDVNGKTLRLSDFKGKVLYLDFWATWCGPCKQEAPHFESLAKEFAGKDVVFLSISTDKKLEDWNGYLKENPKDLSQYHSADEALRTGWEIKFIPRFVVIDKNFNIVDAYAPRPSEVKAREMLNQLLD